MSTLHSRFGRFLLPLLAALALLAPSASTAGSPTRKPTTAKPATKTLAPQSKVSISLSHRIKEGNLIVLLDNRPIFNEVFQKATLAISQTTSWDPISVPAGKHMLTARVNGKNGKTYKSGTYELQLSQKSGIDLIIRMKGDKLVVGPAS